MLSEEKICGIYCIENKENGKKYIGKSIDITSREKRHIRDLIGKRHVNEHLQSSWNLYGKTNFFFYVIEECNKELLSEREIYYIDKFNTVSPNGYNLTYGGDGNSNMLEETKVKLSNINSGKNHPQYGMRGELSHNYGKHHSKETKIKFSNARSGKNNPMYGKHHSKETRVKMSKDRSGENNPNYGKRGWETSRYGKKHSKETINKMSNYHKNNPLSIEARNKLSKLNSGELSSNAKLTEKEVLEIKKLLLEGELSQKEIAKIYNVHHSTISNIKTGNTWKYTS